MDDIDAWVQQSLDRGPKAYASRAKCHHCGMEWHGFAYGFCPGSFELDVEAIQNQGAIDYTIDWSERD